MTPRTARTIAQTSVVVARAKSRVLGSGDSEVIEDVAYASHAPPSHPVDLGIPLSKGRCKVEDDEEKLRALAGETPGGRAVLGLVTPRSQRGMAWHVLCVRFGGSMPLRLHVRSTLLALLLGSTAMAAEPPRSLDARGAGTSTPRVVSLAEAIAYAHAHQPTIRAALSLVKQREEAARVPTGGWLPVVGVSGQLLGGSVNNTTASYVAPSVMDVPRIGGARANSTTSLTPYPSSFVGVGLRQEVFDFGRISAERAAADALVDVARESAAVTRLDIDFGVEEAYFAVFVPPRPCSRRRKRLSSGQRCIATSRKRVSIRGCALRSS